MENSLAALTSSLPVTTRRGSARVALIDLKESSQNVLAECFRQFGVETVTLNGDAEDRLRREKFEACVLHLGGGAGTLMEAVRTSPSNCRMIMYGLGGSVQDALSYSKYGVNAVFNEPLERPAALKLVRATQTLVFHEFRRYVRIPVITEVNIVASENRRFTVTSQEISSGGMSFRSPEDIPIGQSIEISFALLTLPRIWVRGTVTWRKPNTRSIGMRFDAQDERRFRIKEWIEAYFES
jgi:hypothetical protein